MGLTREPISREHIPQEDEDIIAHINDLMGSMYTLSEIANLPDLTREDVVARIQDQRDELKSTLRDLRSYKEELDSREDFERRMEDNWYLREAYEEMSEAIREWQRVLRKPAERS